MRGWLRGAVRSGDQYGLVLLLLVVSFVLSAFLSDNLARFVPVLVDVIAVALAVSGQTSPAAMSGHARRLVIAVVASGGVAAVVAVFQAHNRAARGALSLWLAALLVLTTVAVVQRILSHRVVTLQTIFGALSAYLLIGFLYALLFAAVANLQRAPLFAGGQPVTPSTIQYFSFTTMTTVGYGDFTAAGEPTRSLAVLEALTGQIFLVTLVARLVSIFGQQRGPAR